MAKKKTVKKRTTPVPGSGASVERALYKANKPPKRTPGELCMAELTRKYPDSSYSSVIVNDEFAAADSAAHGHVCVEFKDL